MSDQKQQTEPVSKENVGLDSWRAEELKNFLLLRQEVFLDPIGSNRARFEDASAALLKALFNWYFSQPSEFGGLLALLKERIPAWQVMRKSELETLNDRRFLLNSPWSDVPAIEGSVSTAQWQRIVGSLADEHGPKSFDRFLKDLDEFTDPSLRINHKYLGELLPHDNMVSFLSALAATFLNENAVIGKVSPCVVQMEEAAIQWLCGLVGWQSRSRPETPGHPPAWRHRLPTPYGPSEKHSRWDRDFPTGTVVSGGTVANITAIMIARNATFNYLLGWNGAVQALGPLAAWDIIKEEYKYKRMVVVTSASAHYSVKKSCHYAGIAPSDVIEVFGQENPWRMDAPAVERALRKHGASLKKGEQIAESLLIAMVPIAGTTEHGYVDDLEGIANSLLKNEFLLPSVLTPAGLARMVRTDRLINKKLTEKGKDRENISHLRDFKAVSSTREDSLKKLGLKAADEKPYGRRAFLHVDAAHGGGFLTSRKLFDKYFGGINSSDSVTIDGHKMLYCYYPCGGLLVRTQRWAETIHSGRSSYIAEESNHHAYAEDQRFFEDAEAGLGNPAGEVRRTTVLRLSALHSRLGRPSPASRLELRHEPYKMSLEGSRGSQGIMQLYFNIHTLGRSGFSQLVEWAYLQTRRCEQAVGSGAFAVERVDKPISKQPALDDSPLAGRFLRLSGGQCNQLLVCYVPRVAAIKIASWDGKFWDTPLDKDERGDLAQPGKDRVWRMLYYLWRVNEHLWMNCLYGNPAFTYYVGHTDVTMDLPSHGARGEKQAGIRLADLLNSWNDWARRSEPAVRVPFFDALARRAIDLKRNPDLKVHKGKVSHEDQKLKFFAQKIIIMHPYSDESVLSDLLGKLAFWGERSAEAVDSADAACRDWLNDNDMATGAGSKRKNNTKRKATKSRSRTAGS